MFIAIDRHSFLSICNNGCNNNHQIYGEEEEEDEEEEA
jgi:hypothetical protein